MLRKLIAASLTLSLSVFTPTFASAAAKADKNATTSTSSASHHLANIVFAGLAGAIMGLSTLSFYGRPQDRLSNIAVGFAIGVIGGTIYVTYKAAATPKDFYGLQDRSQAELYAFQEREMRAPPPRTPTTGWTFTF